MSPPARRAIALWHRYGPADHTEEYPALPDLITELAAHCDVHYFGMRTGNPVPDQVARNCILHFLPFRVNRASMGDKFAKTILWYLAIPWMALRCRFMGIHTLFIDESLPFSFLLMRLFFGRSIARTLTDFFLDIYLGTGGPGRCLLNTMTRLELASWRNLPLILTRVEYTRQYLIRNGFAPDRIVPIYNPCNLDLYRQGDRKPGRARYGIPEDAFVFVQHGILHPNKGNERIIRALAELRQTLPRIRYLLVGSGPEMPHLRQLVRDLKMDNSVIFTGWLKTETDVVEALNSADVGLVMRVGLESDNYHVTNTLVHEMACGLPILSARLAGVAEIVRDGENGLLFDPADMERFKSCLTMLAGDAGLRARLGELSRKTAVRLFDKTRVATETARHLLRVVYPEGVPPTGRPA